MTVEINKCIKINTQTRNCQLRMAERSNYEMEKYVRSISTNKLRIVNRRINKRKAFIQIKNTSRGTNKWMNSLEGKKDDSNKKHKEKWLTIKKTRRQLSIASKQRIANINKKQIHKRVHAEEIPPDGWLSYRPFCSSSHFPLPDACILFLLSLPSPFQQISPNFHHAPLFPTVFPPPLVPTRPSAI